jgi:soluble lytic murein transglycosylase-like protein
LSRGFFTEREVENTMENSGRAFIPLAFLSGLLLAAFLWLATSKAGPLIAVQAAGPTEFNNLSDKTDNPPADIPSANQVSQKGKGACQVNRNYPGKILQWCELITEYALRRGIEPDLLAALILQESGGNPEAYSHSGAVGLMQVMPRNGLAASFMCSNGPCFQNRPTIAELKDPEFNISYGTKMLAGLKKKHGNIRDALKYYGPADVGYYYSDIVLSLYQRFRQ